MNSLVKRSHAIVLALATALATAVVMTSTTARAQEGHSGHTGHTGQGQMANMPYDLHYVDMMLMHHQQGVEMAKLAEEKAQNAGVKAFAAKTRSEQEKEIAELKGHREHWYADRPLMDHSEMIQHMGSMPGHDAMKMDMSSDMEKLKAAAGQAFDRMFLEMMIPHHQMAIDMSKEAARKAEHAEIKNFAREAATEQQSEVAEMKRLQAVVGGTTASKPARKPAPKTSKFTGSGHSGHIGH